METPLIAMVGGASVPYASLGLPGGVLVVLLYRAGQILVPQGGTVLEPGDRVLLLAEEDTYPGARDLLAGGREEAG